MIVTDTAVIYWASVLAALNWAYAAFASLWLVLFSREAVKHGTREESGYRIGRAIHWRLPGRMALVVMLWSVLPILGTLFLRGWLALILLALLTATTFLLWLIAPPGLRLVYGERGGEGGATAFELRPAGNPVRSIVVFVLFGLLPAVGVGAVLSWALARVGG